MRLTPASPPIHLPALAFAALLLAGPAAGALPPPSPPERDAESPAAGGGGDSREPGSAEARQDAAKKPGETAAGEERSPWLHLRVTGPDGEQAAKIDVPVGLVEGLLALAQARGQVSADIDTHFEMSEIRAAWKAIREVDDAELVALSDEKQSVHVAVRDDAVRARVVDKTSGAEVAAAELPAGVVDALLGETGQKLDLGAGVRRLARDHAGDVVRLTNGYQTVRVWVD